MSDNEQGLCQREKYWEELTSEERIELLGKRLDYLKTVVDQIAEGIQRQENHVHVGSKIYYEGVYNRYGWPNINIFNRENGGRG